jgi:hypothetical protein
MSWHEIGNIFDLPDDREAYKAAVAMNYPDLKAGAVPVTGGICFASEAVTRLPNLMLARMFPRLPIELPII